MIEITLNENGSVSNREIFIGFTGENLDKTLHFTYPEKYQSYHKYILVNHSVDGTFGVLPINDDKFVVSTFLTSKKYGWELQVMFTEDELDLSAETVDLSPKEGKHQKLFKKIWCGIDRGLYSGEAINAFEEDENVQLFYEKVLKVASESGGNVSSVLIPHELTSMYLNVWDFEKTGYYLITNNTSSDMILVTVKTGNGKESANTKILEYGNNIVKKGECIIAYAMHINTEYQLTLFKNAKSIKTYVNAYVPSSDTWESTVTKVLSDSSFSSTSNGKYLSIVNGVITPTDLPESNDSYIVIVSQQDDSYVADKTFDEVCIAYNNDRNVILKHENEYFYFKSFEEGGQGAWIVFANKDNSKKIQYSSSGGLTLSDYKYYSLTTEDKTLVGAINELKSAIDVLKATAVTVTYDEETETIDFDYVADALAEAEETEVS